MELGLNENINREILANKAGKSLDVKGEIDKLEFNHEQVVDEFTALLIQTKMSRHLKVLMMLLMRGFHIEDALAMAQKHGFLKGATIIDAVKYEAEAKYLMMQQLRKTSAPDLTAIADRGLAKDSDIQNLSHSAEESDDKRRGK